MSFLAPNVHALKAACRAFLNGCICPLCDEPWSKASTFPCGHTFCYDCAIATLEGPGISQSECPTCKQKYWKRDLKPNPQLMSAVEHALKITSIAGFARSGRSGARVGACSCDAGAAQEDAAEGGLGGSLDAHGSGDGNVQSPNARTDHGSAGADAWGPSTDDGHSDEAAGALADPRQPPHGAEDVETEDNIVASLGAGLRRSNPGCVVAAPAQLQAPELADQQHDANGEKRAYGRLRPASTGKRVPADGVGAVDRRSAEQPPPGRLLLHGKGDAGLQRPQEQEAGRAAAGVQPRGVVQLQAAGGGRPCAAAPQVQGPAVAAAARTAFAQQPADLVFTFHTGHGQHACDAAAHGAQAGPARQLRHQATAGLDGGPPSHGNGPAGGGGGVGGAAAAGTWGTPCGRAGRRGAASAGLPLAAAGTVTTPHTNLLPQPRSQPLPGWPTPSHGRPGAGTDGGRQRPGSVVSIRRGTPSVNNAYLQFHIFLEEAVNLMAQDACVELGAAGAGSGDGDVVPGNAVRVDGGGGARGGDGWQAFHEGAWLRRLAALPGPTEPEREALEFELGIVNVFLSELQQQLAEAEVAEARAAEAEAAGAGCSGDGMRAGDSTAAASEEAQAGAQEEAVADAEPSGDPSGSSERQVGRNSHGAAVGTGGALQSDIQVHGVQGPAQQARTGVAPTAVQPPRGAGVPSALACAAVHAAEAVEAHAMGTAREGKGPPAAALEGRARAAGLLPPRRASEREAQAEADEKEEDEEEEAEGRARWKRARTSSALHQKAGSCSPQPLPAPQQQEQRRLHAHKKLEGKDAGKQPVAAGARRSAPPSPCAARPPSPPPRPPPCGERDNPDEAAPSNEADDDPVPRPSRRRAPPKRYRSEPPRPPPAPPPQRDQPADEARAPPGLPAAQRTGRKGRARDRDSGAAAAPPAAPAAAPATAAPAAEGGAAGGAARRGRPVCILATGLSGPDKAKLKELGRRVRGVELLEDVLPQMTHLVVKLTAQGRAAVRTVKYLRAVVQGCWVVGTEWAEACLAAGRLVPEGPYEATGDPVFEGAPALFRQRVERGEPPIFSGIAFCVNYLPAAGKVLRSDVEALLQAAGGRIARRPSTRAAAGAGPGGATLAAALFGSAAGDMYDCAAPSQHTTQQQSLSDRDPEAPPVPPGFPPVVVLLATPESSDASRVVREWGCTPVLRDWVFDSISHFQVLPVEPFSVAPDSQFAGTESTM